MGDVYKELSRQAEAIQLAQEMYENDLVFFGDIWSHSDDSSLREVTSKYSWPIIRRAFHLVFSLEEKRI